MSRPHGRQAHQSRPIKISFDGLARVDGSARFSFGPIAALSSVSGPIEVRLAVENAAQATLEVSVRPLSNVPATEAKTMASTVRALLTPAMILTNNPRTLIQIVSQALVPSGSVSGPRSVNNSALTAAMVNASTLAILNAGSIPMRGVICAVGVGQRRNGGGLVVDPDEGDGALDADGCFAFMFARNGGDVQSQCVWTNWKQKAGDETSLSAAQQLASQAAGDVYFAIHSSVENLYTAIPQVSLLVPKEETKEEIKPVKDEAEDEMEI